MQAQDHLKEGDVKSALSAVMQSVRDEPQKVENRTFLFQLLAVTGDWDRALNQLVVAGEMDSQAIPMVQTYREALSCEALRGQVFSGTRSPLVFGDPEQWIALMLESLKLAGQGKIVDAARLREEAFDAAPAVTGAVNGEPFEWIADADSRIGPFLEAIVNGNYYWIPINRIAQVEIEPPEDLRDLVWLPAQFSWANGGQAIGLIPTRYPGSEASENGLVQLARRTEWIDQGDNTYCGLGQRQLVTDSNEYSLLEIRQLSFDVEPEIGEDS
jgi:type VI secretion system protein ImpE